MKATPEILNRIEEQDKDRREREESLHAAVVERVRTRARPTSGQHYSTYNGERGDERHSTDDTRREAELCAIALGVWRAEYERTSHYEDHAEEAEELCSRLSLIVDEETEQ